MDVFNRKRVKKLEEQVRALDQRQLEVLVKVARQAVEHQHRAELLKAHEDLLRMTNARDILLDATRCSCGRFVPKLKVN